MSCCPMGYITVGGRGRGDEKGSRAGAEWRCCRSTALFATELGGLSLCCASPKPVATTSPILLKLITLAGGVKGLVASIGGVEKGFAGVVAPLEVTLTKLPWRSWGRRWLVSDPRCWRGGRAGIASGSDEPECSRKRGRGGLNESSA